ncbi:MAG: 8-oxo-dGTP diphosphatase MutT [Pseudomonadota bacterium]
MSRLMPNIVPDMSAVHVAVGVILDDTDKVLITRRATDSHQGGLWEFPGGKVEPGESLDIALSRELLEELGLVVDHTEPLIEIRHDYGDKCVRLEVRLVRQFTGRAKGLEGQPLAWVAPEQLSSYRFPEANAPIIDALKNWLNR